MDWVRMPLKTRTWLSRCKRLQITRDKLGNYHVIRVANREVEFARIVATLPRLREARRYAEQLVP